MSKGVSNQFGPFPTTGEKAPVADATAHEKTPNRALRRSRRVEAGATIAWVLPPAMSGQTILIKNDPREGVKKNLSEISEKKDVWPLGGIGGMDSGDLQSGIGGVGRPLP